jgi:hypothetical protein
MRGCKPDGGARCEGGGRATGGWAEEDDPMTDQFQPTARDPHPGAPADETGDATGVESMESGGGRAGEPGDRVGETRPDAGLTPHTQPAEGGREEAEADLDR